MFYHLITHTGCNLSCTYCDRDDFGPIDEQTYDYNTPSRITYNKEKLQKFITKEDYITFYGGEPLLAIKDIKEIMDTVECKGFMIQTNGTLFNHLEPIYTNRFHTILISLDGGKQVTEKNRGPIHNRVMQNIKLIKERGFNGELIARMTITQGSNLYEQVFWLLDNGFENIHWQLDIMFYEDSPMAWLEQYNKQLTQLLDYWVQEMKKGNVRRFYPFLILMDNLLQNKKTRLPCGSGYENYTITTNGNLAPCPIMGSMKKYYCGTIDSPEIKQMDVKEPCTSCDILNFCGGRCLYVNLTKKGGKESFSKMCDTVKYLHKELLRVKPIVEELIQNKTISSEDFKHLKFNGIEVIP
jgi:uncharacterized protein